MTFKIIKNHPKGVRGIYEASKQELLTIFHTKLVDNFLKFRNDFDPIKELEKLKRDGIKVLTVDSEDFPESLKNISDPPICLYFKGDTKLFANRKVRFQKNLSPVGKEQIFFAIVGTRKPTSYGIQVAKKFAYELAEAGFVIVSGMALGIDACAHQAALDAGGITIAVLGCGVNLIYPSANRQLYENIIKTGGAVISEFPPNQMALKGMFIARNRIISGLSKGVLIVEGLKDSGALITARFAGEQGKEVFATPSPITSAMSAAPNFLLKQGARLVTSVEDIYEDFNMRILPRQKENVRCQLDGLKLMIYDILEKNPQTVDELAITLGKPVAEILNIMSVMEIKSIFEKNQENRYQIKV